MDHALRIPEVGESIREVQVAKWLKPEGSWVQKDENVVEIETEKATVDIPAPASGTIARVLKAEGQPAEVGEVIGYVTEGDQPPAAAPGEVSAPLPFAPSEVPAPPSAAFQPAAQSKADLPPAVETAPTEDPSAELGSMSPESTPAASLSPPTAARQEEEVPMTLVRRRIARRLVEAQQTAALLTTFNEIDMESLAGLRRRYREAFQARYGVKLGIMSFFVKAAIEGLRLHPVLNAEVRDASVVYRNYYDVGIAIAGDKGLVVPVVRDAQRLSFAQIEQAIDDFANRAAANRLKPDELSGGTFTITNGGVFGSLLSTPIVNPPQSAILGLHAIQERPVAREGQVVVRPMMYVALTYDHRVVDGREAVGFLRRVKEIIEDPARMLLEL